MAIPILINRSTVPGKVPAAGSLELGELALNIADGKWFYLTLAGAITELTGTVPPDATETANGLMSAADKMKLDHIQANAEANVPANLRQDGVSI